MEQRQNIQDDKKQLEIIEKLYSEASDQVEKEYASIRKKSNRSKKKIRDIDDGEELWSYMENSNDSIEVGLCSESFAHLIVVIIFLEIN